MHTSPIPVLSYSNLCFLYCYLSIPCLVLFFFNDTATTEIYTLSLHDALPICAGRAAADRHGRPPGPAGPGRLRHRDRKSTRLNSSHQIISYAVFCLKKKKNKTASIDNDH